VEPRFTPYEHFYCAYPDASTRGVIALTDARRKFGQFAGEAARPPERFVGPAHGPTLLGGPRQHTHTLSVLTPVVSGCEKTLSYALKHLPTGLDSPLDKVPNTHMARWSIVAPLPYKNRPKRRPTINDTSYLLFTSWFDGDTYGYIRELGVRLGKVADDVWGNCVAYPGSRDDRAFSDYMVEHSIRPLLAFGGYPQSVMEVRAADELHSLLENSVAEAAMLDIVELEKRWRERGRPTHAP
jgi:hypothetical protein